MNYIIQADSDHFISIPEMQRELNPWKDVISLYKLFQIIRRIEPHIVHSHAAKAGTIARVSVVLCNLFYRQDIKTIHTFHGHVFKGYFSKLKSSFFIWTERLLAVFTDKIIAISPTQREDLVTKYRISNNDKVVTIKLGFDLEPFVHSTELKGNFRKELTINNEVKLVGIVGRLVPVKNHFMFLNAVKYFMSQHPDMKILFAVIGDGEMRDELHDSSIRLGISEHVCFYGWIKDITKVYADLDLLALTSINEGTPVSIIEAMSSGVPVISTDAGGIRDLLGNRIGPQSSNGFRVCERGILLPQSDPKSLAEGMRYIFDDTELGNQQMISNARQFVLSEYHQDRLIQDIRSLYNDLLR
jgi:glycosyltransferase involved in cell wall biosynthesis